MSQINFIVILVIDLIKLFWYLIHVERMVKGNSISIDVKEDKHILDGQKFH